MSRPMVEVHAELLLGCRVRDREGQLVGRIEEFRAEPRDEGLVLTEYHLGSAALLERLAISALQLPFLNLLPRRGRIEYRVRWDQMDLTDPDHPRVNVSRDELARGGPERD